MTPETLNGPTTEAAVIPIERGLRSSFKDNIGMSLFLFSWGITFVGLAVCYLIIWWREPVWPPSGTPPRPLVFPVFNTLFVVASSITYDLSVRSARRNDPVGVRRWFVMTGLLAGAFLVLQSAMWADLWASGMRIRLNTYAGLFYALTVFHAAHVVAGIGVLLVLAPRVMRGGFTLPEHTSLRLSGWFWHFVTVAWLGVFVLLWGL